LLLLLSLLTGKCPLLTTNAIYNTTISGKRKKQHCPKEETNKNKTLQLLSLLLLLLLLMLLLLLLLLLSLAQHLQQLFCHQQYKAAEAATNCIN